MFIWEIKNGKKLLKITGCCLLALVMIMCFGNISQAAPKEVKVAAVLSLTGKMSGQGVQLKEAYEILVEKINKEGGVYTAGTGLERLTPCIPSSNSGFRITS